MPTEGRAVGQTASVGFQVGVRRTLPCADEALWRLLTSEEGLTGWLGGPIPLQQGATYTLADGTTGELRIFRPGSHLRLTWQPPGWAAPATVQVRVLPAKGGTTLSIHQERLPDGATRAAMKAHWEERIARLAALL
jgi:uncharacterized protein YndB with AHSA1/START domain